MMADLPPRARYARRIGFAAWGLLAALQVIWHGLGATSTDAAIVITAIALMPLLLPLIAIRHPARALLWVGMIALFYFCHGVSEAWAVPADRVLALVEIALSVILIFAVGFGIPKRRRAGQAQTRT
jgi:uncharacterized membrane protein